MTPKPIDLKKVMSEMREAAERCPQSLSMSFDEDGTAREEQERYCAFLRATQPGKIIALLDYIENLDSTKQDKAMADLREDIRTVRNALREDIRTVRNSLGEDIRTVRDRLWEVGNKVGA